MIKTPAVLKHMVLNDIPCSTMFCNGFALIRTHFPRETGLKNTVTRLRYNEETQEFEEFKPDGFPAVERRKQVVRMLSQGVRPADLASLFRVVVQQITNDSGAGMR